MTSPNLIRCFHYSRLTDEEVTKIESNGFEMPSLDLLKRRLKLLVRLGYLNDEEARHISENANVGRAGYKFYAVGRPHPPTCRSVSDFLDRWGGEAVHDAANSWPELTDKLSGIGRGRIFELNVDEKCVRAGDLATLTREQDVDIHIECNLPAGAIVRVLTQGNVEYSCMGRPQ